MKRITVPAILCLLCAIIGWSCNQLSMKSTWRTAPITIDGNDADWDGALAHVKKADIDIGVRNDGTTLYLCLVTSNAQTEMQIMRGGFTIWMSSENADKKSYGLRYPIGQDGPPAQMPPMGEDGRPDREAMEKMMEQSMSEVEIIGPGENDRNRMTTLGTNPFVVKINRSRERFVYEMAMPLARTAKQPYGIDAQPGQNILLGFETPENKMQGGPGGQGGPGEGGPEGGGPGGMPGGGMPGGGGPGGMPGGGGPGGGGPGGRSRDGMSRSERLNLWIQVALASGAPGTAPAQQ